MINKKNYKKSKVLLWGWFGFENLGDDLLLYTMLNRVNCEITVPMKKKYSTIDAKQIKRSYINLLFGFFNNDYLIIGPGGLFPFDNKLKVLIYYIVVTIWSLVGKKVIFFGVGISEKMSDFSVILWKKIVNKSVLFIPRSDKVLKRIGLNESKEVHSMADCVFASDLSFDNAFVEKNKVAISVANIQEDNIKAFDDSVSNWTNVVNALIKKGIFVDLIAFTKGADDRMIDAILSNIQNNEGLVQPIYYKNSTEVVRRWNKYEFVICMRFHSLVLSILNDVPAIPIAYGHKTLSLAEKSGLGEYTLVWNVFQSDYYGEDIAISATQILEKIDLLYKNIDRIRIDERKNKDQLIESATDSFTQLKMVLSK